MNKWSTCNEAQVLFTDKHQQTEDTMKLYIHLIKLTYKDFMNIGLLIDRVTMNDSKGFVTYVEASNMTPPTLIWDILTNHLPLSFPLPIQL